MSETGFLNRLLLLSAGAAGSVGVVSMAAGAHGGGPLEEGNHFTTAGLMLIMHASALLALCNASQRWRGLRLAGVVLALGVGLFSGDLISRAMIDEPLFAAAAPAGGITLIAGWVLVGIGALLGARRDEHPGTSPPSVPPEVPPGN